MRALHCMYGICGALAMGGGGGGGSLGNIERLEAVANRALERRRRNIFISFAYEDIDEVNLLRGQARNENSDIDFIDRSLKAPFNSNRAEYIRNRLEDRIKQSSMTVVYLSEHTRNSKWVDWEVKKSVELGKEICAVHVGSRPPSQLPTCIERYGVKVVPWRRLANELI